MQKIDIRINQAKLLNYSVELKDDKPEVTAKIGLYAGEKRISDFSICSHDYYSYQKFDLPLSFIEPIMKIVRELEIIVTRECSAALALLPAPKGEINA